MSTAKNTLPFIMTIKNNPNDCDQIESVNFSWDENAGITAATLMGLAVQQFLQDESLVTECVNRAEKLLDEYMSEGDAENDVAVSNVSKTLH